MYRHPSYSENNDWENLNQSQRGQNNRGHYEPYHPSHPGNRVERSFDNNSGQYNQGQYQQGQSGPQNFRQEPGSETYRGAYRLDNRNADRERYERLNQENFGYDYGYGHSGNSRNGGDRGRHQSDYGTGSTYGASRNAGSMGSYGGAQGYGSSRGGHNTSNDEWTSGHHDRRNQPEHRIYGAYRDSNSFADGEKESYDGTQRYGSQGADNSRGWASSGRSGTSGRRTSRQSSEDDSRYEIYDTALSQYNRGEYGNPTQGSISEELNLRTHQNYPPYQYYGSRQRGNRQGSGNDQDSQLGTDMDYGNTAGSLSVGYDGYLGEPHPRNRYYDPLTGEAWNPGSERNM